MWRLNSRPFIKFSNFPKNSIIYVDDLCTRCLSALPIDEPEIMCLNQNLQNSARSYDILHQIPDELHSHRGVRKMSENFAPACNNASSYSSFQKKYLTKHGILTGSTLKWRQKVPLKIAKNKINSTSNTSIFYWW